MHGIGVSRARISFLKSLVVAWCVLCSGCLLEPQERDYYGRVVVPQTREFRWSNGGVPKVFDPALAAAAPDTDAVRALFEGLTDYDPQSLTPIPAVAERWQSSSDNREWTFFLRRNARWSNGDPVTAQDFVRSWQRAVKLRERAAHAELLNVIEGAGEIVEPLQTEQSADGTSASIKQPSSNQSANSSTRQTATTTTRDASASQAASSAAPSSTTSTPAIVFGAIAMNDYTLRVRLVRPDTNLPALVAHTVFRPVHASVTEGTSVDGQPLAASNTDTELLQNRALPSAPTTLRHAPVICNGAFELNAASYTANELVLVASKTYWSAATVKLERVRFIGTRDAESALSAYRAGEVDAVTNASLQPLAIKLLTPYKDFRRTTFGALTYYAFNRTRAPFNDARVRRAFALALDRSRLTADDMSGATVPATKFVPPTPSTTQTNGQATTTTSETEQSPTSPANKAASSAQASPVTSNVTDTTLPIAKETSEAKNANEAQSQNIVENQNEAAADPPRARNKPSAFNKTLDANVTSNELTTDANEARRLLNEAGFPSGANFPVVRLLVNRNDQQRRIAAVIAQMWQSTLGVKTEIIVKDWQEYEAAVATGDFDIARRSFVLQTMDETTNMLQIFDYEAKIKNEINKEAARAKEEADAIAANSRTAKTQNADARRENDNQPERDANARTIEFESPRTEVEALREAAAIPVYFARSFALVKPYVNGFDSNLFDAPSLQRVRVDSTWRQQQQQQPDRKEATWTSSTP